jgi:pyruvate dehydrogenase E1 component alpha subunit
MYAYNFPVIPVDGNDVVAVYRVAYECTVRAREGGGPSIIVCQFPTSNKALRHKRDPLLLMEKYLSAKGLFQAKQKLISTRAFEKELTKAKAASKALPDSKRKQNAENIFFL